MKISSAEKAGILVEALPYIKKYFGKIIVISYAKPCADEAVKKSFIKDLVLLDSIGIKVVLVHGGKKEAAEFYRACGIDIGSNIECVGQLMQAAVAGKINKDLTAQIYDGGGKSVGLCGTDGQTIQVNRDGAIVRINVSEVLSALEQGNIPVIAAVGASENGGVILDTDLCAARLAGELKAECMIALSDEAGIVKKGTEQDQLIPVINVSEVSQLIKEGVISGENAVRANALVEGVRRGVRRVFLIDGGKPHAVLVEILSDEGIGTMFL